MALSGEELLIFRQKKIPGPFVGIMAEAYRKRLFLERDADLSNAICFERRHSGNFVVERRDDQRGYPRSRFQIARQLPDDSGNSTARRERGFIGHKGEVHVGFSFSNSGWLNGKA